MHIRIKILIMFFHIVAYGWLSIRKSILSRICCNEIIDSSLFAKNTKATKQKSFDPNVEKYLQLRELIRLQKSGASYEELKLASINNTSTSNASSVKKPSYNRLLGKGNLDQRLRAIIAYKRSNTAAEAALEKDYDPDNIPEEELLEMMDSTEGDDEVPYHNEEAEYEALVLQAMETNKLNDIKSRMLGELRWDAKSDLSKQNRVLDSANATSDVSPSSPSPAYPTTGNASEEDLYTPAVSTWGVYKRPRDISKAFGGGRSISKEEMDRMDAEFDEREKAAAQRTNQILTDAMKIELENKVIIEDNLQRARTFLRQGDRESAVASLEKIKEFASFQTDLGGTIWLELGMALETVDRIDEARQVYGKLASKSWSQKIRKQALQLISGLDITKQIRKHAPIAKVELDPEQMKLVSQTLEKGLRNEWDAFKKDSPQKRGYMWIDDDFNNAADGTLKVTTLAEAYTLLAREINPLKKVPSEALYRAFKKFYLVSQAEKEEFLRKKPPINPSPKAFPSNSSYPFSYINGSWELVSSLVDSSPYIAKRYEVGSVRRVLVLADSLYRETNSVFFGMSTAQHDAKVAWNPVRYELSVSGKDLKRSLSPWQRTSQNEQVFQITYSDEFIMITRQVSDDISTPDLYVLWRRLRDNLWNKY